jgi:hypothetical protein
MDDAITTPQALMAVFASVDWKKWGSRGQVLAALGNHPGGCEVSLRQLEEILGRDLRYVRRLVDRLVEERVLLAAPGRGRCPTLYAVSLAVHEWQGVPWRVPVAEVGYRVFHVEHEARATPDSDPVARAFHGRALRNPPRASHGRAQGFVARAPKEARASSRPDDVARASKGRAQDSASARSQGGARYEPGPQGVVTPPSVEVDPRVTSSPSEEEAESFNVARSAVLRHAGGGWLRGRPADQLRRLVADHALEEVLAAVESSPPDHRPPWIVQHAAEVLDAAVVAAATAPMRDPLDVDLAGLRLRRQQLVQLVDLYASESPGSTEEQHYRELLDACETAIMSSGGTL